MLVRSPHARVMRFRGRDFIYNALAGTCVVCDRGVWELLRHLDRPASMADLMKRHPEYRDQPHVFQRLAGRLLLVPPGHDLREQYRRKREQHLRTVASGHAVRNLTLVVNENCNFHCAYCMENSMIDASARAFEKGRRMSPETARTALVQYFELLREQGVKTARIGFSGGEPLLNWSLVRFCMHEAERLAERCGITSLHFGLNTNASLVTRGIARQLSRYSIETVTVGLDGPERVNDAVRVLRNGKGTFGRIMAGLAVLRDYLETPIGVITVLTHETLPFIQDSFLDFLKREGVSYFVAEPDLVRFPEVQTDTLCDLLISLQRYGEEIGMEVQGLWLRPSLNFTSGDTPGGRMPMYHCNCQGGRSVTITSTGLVGICPWTSPTFGHVSRLREVLASEAYGDFIGRRFNTNIRACRGCSLEGTCDGGCYVSWDGGESLRKRCSFYRKITRRLIQERIGAA